MLEVSRPPTDTLLAPIGTKVVFDGACNLYQLGQHERFDPLTHLSYEPPSQRHSLTELDLDPLAKDNKSDAVAVTDLAYTEPFRLLSEEGVQAVRSEIFSQKVLDSCAKRVTNQQGDAMKFMSIRNPGKQSTFLLEMWKSPVMQAAINDALGGYQVVPAMDHECSHANLQVPQIKLDPNAPDNWHTDGVAQFVVVLMLSDPSKVSGGETQIRCGDGSVRNVNYPAAGYAIMLQGMVVHHNVRPVYSKTGELSGERLTMVTCFQPADHQQPQQSVVGYLRRYSDEEQLLGEWAAWRFKVMSQRLADASAKIAEDKESGEFDLGFIREHAAQIRKFLAITEREVAADYDPAKVYNKQPV